MKKRKLGIIGGSGLHTKSKDLKMKSGKRLKLLGEPSGMLTASLNKKRSLFYS